MRTGALSPVPVDAPSARPLLLQPAAARPAAHSAAMKNCLYIIPPRSEASTL
jgi:hypothetical protein